METKTCEHCKSALVRRKREGLQQFAARRFCSQRCNGDSRKIVAPREKMTKGLRCTLRARGVHVAKLKPGIKPALFWTLVDKSTACWLWTGPVNRDGYGVYCNDGTHMAHRYAWLQVGRELPSGKVLMHRCDNPPCVNPDHLFLGTHSDNRADCVRKNRQARGSQSGTAKLSETLVSVLRARYKPHRCTYQMLADEFGLHKDTVQKAVRGLNWRHVA